MYFNRILSKDLINFIDQDVTIAGWLHKKREVSSKLAFVILRDRNGLIQVVCENEIEIAKLKGLQIGSILRIQGIVKKEERAALGVEIHNPLITVDVEVKEVSPIEIDKPIDHTSQNFDTLFENRVVNIRSVEEQNIFRVRSVIKNAVRSFLVSQDFTEIDTPKLLAGATEGGAEVFTLDYFGQTAALAQSAQFYKQIMVGAFERVFEINPTYRAEPSFTPRHMTEFMHIDVEIGFLSSHQELLDMAGEMLTNVCNVVWGKSCKELKAMNSVKPVLPIPKSQGGPGIPSITLTELLELYYKETGEDNRSEKDPSPVHERFASEYFSKHFKSEAVFITEFPSSDMKFYHRKNDSNSAVCDRADLIFRGVELATIPLRENRYKILIEQMKAAGIDPEAIGNKYYVMAFKHGLPIHGGWGWGLERLVQKIIGLSSVKEATLFPRDLNRLAP